MKTPAVAGTHASWVQRLRQLFEETEAIGDVIPDDADTILRHRRLVSLINAQAMAIGILALILIFAAPLLRPVNRYFSVNPGTKERRELVGLFVPNLTDQAILSWAATSVTEVMTLGFGDFDQQILGQRRRFTSEGWDSFRQALEAKKLRNDFKTKQLVLTTVPSGAPVIVWRGPDLESDSKNGYKWVVEVPVIMTYVTNNNVSKKDKKIIRLTIVRVPGRESVGGIAIRTWDLV